MHHVSCWIKLFFQWTSAFLCSWWLRRWLRLCYIPSFIVLLFIYLFFFSVCLHRLALLLYLTINPGTHLCLCLPFHVCGYVFMKQTEPICIQVLLPFKSFLYPSMACGLQFCATSWVTQRSPGFPCNLQLFIMHSTPLDYCRSRALHHCSLQREAGTD